MEQGMDDGTAASAHLPSAPDVPGEPWPLPAPKSPDDTDVAGITGTALDGTELDGTALDGTGDSTRRTDRRLIVGALAAVGLMAITTLTLAGGGESSISDAEPVNAVTAPSAERTTVPITGPEPSVAFDEERSQMFTSRARSSAPTGRRATSTTAAPPTTAPPTTAATTTTTSVAPPATPPPLPEDPAVVARPIPDGPPPPPPPAPPPPWASSVFTTEGGHVSTEVGCVADLSARSLDAFFAERVGPVIGWDYQHVYPLGNGRNLWLFQDVFIDQSGTAGTLDRASFAHNAALVQDGTCFRLLHGGSITSPAPFEPGTGTTTRETWFWPMGGEVHGGRLYVFWAEMRKDGVDPSPPDGLGWHPVATHVGTYDPNTLVRLDFRPATQPYATPLWGYAVESDDTYTYLFGNTFEQNLTREGGWRNGPHSGTRMYVARVPRGAMFDQPEYWTSAGWIGDERRAEPFLQRHWAEFPMQPRYIDGQWVAVAAVDGYWGSGFSLDVANNPWGPWTTVESRGMQPRGADPKMNTYHAHLMPWRDGSGRLVVSVSNNARDMLKDAFPHPHRYRPMVMAADWRSAPTPTTVPPTTPTTTTTTTARATTTSAPPSTAPPSTAPPTARPTKRPTTTSAPPASTTVPKVTSTATTATATTPPSKTAPPKSSPTTPPTVASTPP